MSSSSVQIEINYPPNFKPRYGYGSPQAKHLLALFREKEPDQLTFLSKIEKYRKQFSSIPIDAEESSVVARWNQGWFPPLDGMSLYALIASNKPKKYIEIGSGNSTKFASQAIRDNSLNTEIISVDPHPRAEVDSICDMVIRKPLEEASELEEILIKLKPNDILFFDGSHRCFQNSDVTAFFIDYLPSVPEGVTIGIHDIFWPYDYPENWTKRYYNEQYILGAYMLGKGIDFSLIFSCKYMQLNFGEELNNCLDVKMFKNLEKLGLGIIGGALWFVK